MTRKFRKNGNIPGERWAGALLAVGRLPPELASPEALATPNRRSFDANYTLKAVSARSAKIPQSEIRIETTSQNRKMASFPKIVKNQQKTLKSKFLREKTIKAAPAARPCFLFRVRGIEWLLQSGGAFGLSCYMCKGKPEQRNFTQAKFGSRQRPKSQNGNFS